MKTTILVIAHNEEKYIGKCLESLVAQTQKADEIVVVVHNSTDRTLEIVQTYPARVVLCHEKGGIVAARLAGISVLTSDGCVLCIDGDSYAAPNWVSEMTHLLTTDNNRLVGSWVKWKGNSFYHFHNFFNKYFCVSKGKHASRWIWGTSMGFWCSDRERISALLTESALFTVKHRLSRNPDDFFVAWSMLLYGNEACTNRTSVTAHMKEIGFWEGVKRHRENIQNGRIIARESIPRKEGVQSIALWYNHPCI